MKKNKDKVHQKVLSETMDFLESRNNAWGKLDGRDVGFALLHCVFSVIFGMTDKKNAMSLISFCLMSHVTKDEVLGMISEVENEIAN